MAVLLHFSFLCAFAWMLVEGLHLYSMVIKVFGSEDSKHFYYYAIGWGECTRTHARTLVRFTDFSRGHQNPIQMMREQRRGGFSSFVFHFLHELHFRLVGFVRDGFLPVFM